MRDENYERAIATWLKRTAEQARTLGDQWDELAGFVIPGGGAGDGTGRAATKVHAAAPIRVEVVALRDDIAAMARRYYSLVRGTLRMGVAPKGGNAPTWLRFIAGALPRLHAEDADLCEEVADAIWSHHRKAARIMDPIQGTVRRPFRIDDPCPACGEMSLWVDPAHWRIGCGMPACREVWGIGEPVLRVSGTNV